jgi:CheY-like chemotaxis protein
MKPLPSATGPSPRAVLEAALLLGEQAAPARHAPEAVRAWTILVADADAGTRRYVGRCLESAGLPRPVRIVEAPEGAVALRCLRDEAVDAVVADLHLPGLDGAGLAAVLDADAVLSALPVLFVSGDAGAARPLLRATRHVLAKPFNRRSLAEAVRALLGASEPSCIPRTRRLPLRERQASRSTSRSRGWAPTGAATRARGAAARGLRSPRRFRFRAARCCSST